MVKAQTTSHKPQNSHPSVSEILDQIRGLSAEEKQELYSKLASVSFFGGSGVNKIDSISQQVQLNISMIDKSDIPGILNEFAKFYAEMAEGEKKEGATQN